MNKREDAIDMIHLGTDGVIRTYGFHAPDFTEPYVLDYRQLDFEQLLQYITAATENRPSRTHNFDLSNLPDSRSVVDKKQLWEPADLDKFRQQPAQKSSSSDVAEGLGGRIRS